MINAFLLFIFNQERRPIAVIAIIQHVNKLSASSKPNQALLASTENNKLLKLVGCKSCIDTKPSAEKKITSALSNAETIAGKLAH